MTHRILRLLPICILSLLALAAAPARAQDCFTFDNDVIRLGDVMRIPTIDTTIRLTPDSGPPMRIVVTYSNEYTNTHFRIISDPDTIDILQGAAKDITLRIDSLLPGEHEYSIFFQVIGGCKDTLTIIANGIDSTSAGSVLPLTPGLTQTFAFYTEAENNNKALLIQNTTTASITIVGPITSLDPSKLQNLKHSPLPLILKPGDIFPISFEFIADSTGFHRSGVRVPTDNGLASEYSIQVIRFEKGVGSVAPIVSKSGVRISQSIGEIAIDGLPFDRGELAIYDLLGRRVRHHEINTNEFILQKQDDSGQPLPDGGYIVSIRDKSGRIHENLKILLLSY